MSSAEKRQAGTHPDSVKIRQRAIDQDILFPKTHQFLGAWEQITNDPETLKIIEGYSIKFQQTPFQMRPPPPLRNLSEGEIAAVDKEIVDLVKNSAIEVCLHTSGAFVSNIFTSPKNSGGTGPGIDVRALNEFMEYISFRMEDISPIKSVLKQGDFMTKLGLRDISNCPSGHKIENFSSLHVEGRTLPIHLPPFRSLFFWQNFHQSNEASDCISHSQYGDQNINFSRKYIDHGKLSQACNATHRLGNPGL